MADDTIQCDCGNTVPLNYGINDLCPYCGKSLFGLYLGRSISSAMFSNEPISPFITGERAYEDVLMEYAGEEKDVVVPDGLIAIGNQAFSGNSNIESVVLPDGLTNIMDGTTFNRDCVTNGSFYNCKHLNKIVLPRTLLHIGVSAFSNCSNLESIRIPSSTDSIGVEAFSGCRSMRSVILSNGVIDIGDYAFYDCKSIAEITIPNSVCKLGEGVFTNCTSLKKVILSDRIKVLRKNTFKNCEALTEVILPEELETIEDGVFENCKSLAQIVFPKKVKNVALTAFSNCNPSLSLPISISGNERVLSRIYLAHGKLFPKEYPCTGPEMMEGFVDVTHFRVLVDGVMYSYGEDNKINLPIDLIYCGKKPTENFHHFIKTSTFKEKYLGGVSRFNGFSIEVEKNRKLIEDHLKAAGIINYKVEIVKVPILVERGVFSKRVVNSGSYYSFVHVLIE